MTIQLETINLWKFNVYAVLADEKRITPPSSIEETKRMMVNMDPSYMLTVTLITCLLHGLFELLAFKNGMSTLFIYLMRCHITNECMYTDISFWINKSNSIGVSINSIVITILFQVITFDSHSLLKGTMQLIRISIEVWKLYCLFRFEFYWTLLKKQKARFFIKIVRIQHTNLMIQKGQRMTQSLDATALHCLACIVIPFLFYFGFSTFLKFASVFTIAPQLYINYKMNRVDHLSLNTMIYKSINIAIGNTMYLYFLL